MADGVASSTRAKSGSSAAHGSPVHARSRRRSWTKWVSKASPSTSLTQFHRPTSTSTVAVRRRRFLCVYPAVRGRENDPGVDEDAAAGAHAAADGVFVRLALCGCRSTGSKTSPSTIRVPGPAAASARCRQRTQDEGRSGVRGEGRTVSAER